MIILGKNPGLVSSHSNIEGSPGIEHEEYLLANALKQAELGSITIPAESFEDQPEDRLFDSESTTSSSSIHSKDNLKEESEKDGLAYIAGYLAKKLKEKHPELGKYTYQINEGINMHSYGHFPSWIKNLSFGGLIQPSDEWLDQVQRMDKYFVKLHKDNFKFKKHIIKRTTRYISTKVTDVQNELVASFARQRVFVRIKFLNIKKEEKQTEKRKASSDVLRKQIKKMKKTVT